MGGKLVVLICFPVIACACALGAGTGQCSTPGFTLDIASTGCEALVLASTGEATKTSATESTSRAVGVLGEGTTFTVLSFFVCQNTEYERSCGERHTHQNSFVFKFL